MRIVAEQQVSVPSAQAVWARARAAVDVADPGAVARFGADGLRSVGFTRQKSGYVADLAALVADGGFDFGRLPALDDETARAALQAIRGVGPWTAAIYLLFCEGRPDVWPPKDVALKGAYNAAAERADDQAAIDAGAEAWRPFRGVAAHVLWTYYAVLKGREPI